jgi:hypothetical protein
VEVTADSSTDANRPPPTENAPARSENAEKPASPDAKADKKANKKTKKRRRSLLRALGTILLFFVVLLVIARFAAPTFVRWYVNSTIDRDPRYDGKIGDVNIHLWRGAYSIEDIRLIKTTGNVPVPLFAAKHVDLAIEWNALLHGKLVGKIAIEKPELNFVDSDTEGEDQTGAGGPWLGIIRDLFPFKINSATVSDGTIHFRAFHSDPLVDVYLSDVDGALENLTNINDDTAPLISTVKIHAMAMDSGRLDYLMKFDPTSYHPTFEMAVKLIGLDVTKTNDLARAYGAFDFEGGWFDLVVELKAREGQVEGYVKPLFRNVKIFSVRRDIPEDNIIEVFWEALVGTTTKILENRKRDQFGTLIPMKGDMTAPKTDILATIGDVLRTAFVRAYLPRLRGTADVDWLQFGPGDVTDPDAPGSAN